MVRGGMKRAVVIHSSPHTNSVRVPHVRTSVRGLTKTGRSPIKALSFLPRCAPVETTKFLSSFMGKINPQSPQLCRLDQVTCLRQVKNGMNAAFRLYPVDRSKGAPYLARFWRDVGYRNCLLTHAPSKTCSLGPECTRERSGGTCCFPCRGEAFLVL